MGFCMCVSMCLCVRLTGDGVIIEVRGSDRLFLCAAFLGADAHRGKDALERTAVEVDGCIEVLAALRMPSGFRGKTWGSHHAANPGRLRRCTRSSGTPGLRLRFACALPATGWMSRRRCAWRWLKHSMATSCALVLSSMFRPSASLLWRKFVHARACA